MAGKVVAVVPEAAHRILHAIPALESIHDQLNYYLGFRKYATYVLNWPICQLRPIVIQEIAAENTVGLCLEAA